jgi:hypothetical protein
VEVGGRLGGGELARGWRAYARIRCPGLRPDAHQVPYRVPCGTFGPSSCRTARQVSASRCLFLTVATVALGWLPAWAAADVSFPDKASVRHVSTRFVEALADRDTHACHYLTRDAIRIIKIASRASTCAKGVHAQNVLFDQFLFGVTPRQLTGDLDRAQIRRRDSSVEFRLPFAGRKGSLSLRLVRVGARARVDRISAGYTYICHSGEPCGLPTGS